MVSASLDVNGNQVEPHRVSSKQKVTHWVRKLQINFLGLLYHHTSDQRLYASLTNHAAWAEVCVTQGQMSVTDHGPVLVQSWHDITHLTMAKPKRRCPKFVKDADLDRWVVALIFPELLIFRPPDNCGQEFVPDYLLPFSTGQSPRVVKQCLVVHVLVPRLLQELVTDAVVFTWPQGVQSNEARLHVDSVVTWHQHFVTWSIEEVKVGDLFGVEVEDVAWLVFQFSFFHGS